jgi:hypothetical protein
VTYKQYYEPLGGEFAKGPEALQMHTGMVSERPRCSATH